MKKYPKKIWLIIWCIFYAIILIFNYFYQDSLFIKTISCLAIGLNIFYASRYSPKDHLLQVALAFTFLADVILAIDNTSFLGVFVFSFAQFFHFARLTSLEPRHFLTFLITLTIIIYLTSIFGLEPMFIIGSFYACLLCANFIISLLWYKNSRSLPALHASLGFFLFILCDICVATSYLARLGSLPFAIHSRADYLSWIFYYPSQIFLSNSSKNKNTMIQ